MRYINFLLAAVFTCATFFSLEVIWGESGILQYRERGEIVRKLQENTMELQQKNQALLADLRMLREDPDYLLRFASQAGYFRSDQGLIKTEKDYSSSHAWEVGRIQYIPPAANGGRTIRAGIAAMIGMAVYLIGAMSSGEPRRRALRLEVSNQAMHRAV
ncbi:MAG: FtsB family cell division protein [Spirochaeta sp.]